MDFVLKQRLVGAVVLVALGVIFIPMLLEGPDRTLVPDIDTVPELVDEAPGRPLASFPEPEPVDRQVDRSVVMKETGAPALADGTEQPLALPPAEPPADTGSAAAEPVATSPEPALAPEPIPEPKPENSVAPSSDELAGWVVQVGSFSSEPNALALRDKLRKAGFTTQVERVQVDGAQRYRVRVGPYLERADAEKDQQQIAKGFPVKPRVLSHP